MITKHSNIPIFLPELACPHRCVFCNQSRISGQFSVPKPSEVIAIIEMHLHTIPANTSIQIAFFGGSFTGLPVSMQEEYLSIVQPYLKSGSVTGIRISTRPDYITEEILDMLIGYGVEEIELGAQSFDNEVLLASGRGHTNDDILKASKLILSKNIRLGLQMMIGLPGDTIEKSIQTARSIIAAGAHSTRIYPTLVIKDTHLADLYSQGKYQVLSLEEAVRWSAHLFQLFEENGVTVLRTGLHPNEDFNSKKSLIDGPYHPSFKELVLSQIWFDIFEKSLPNEKGRLTIFVPENQINHAIGYHSENREKLKNRFGWIQIKADKSLHNYDFRYSYH